MAGFFTFRWAHPAGEVYVTGTFDDWQKSTKLERDGETFVAKVELPVAKTLYKFVVDGTWVVDQSARKEFENGIENNLLIPEDIVAEEQKTEMSATTISSAAPESTTAALAAEVPLEAPAVHTPGPSDVPGGFIETPAFESADPIIAEKKEEAQEFSVKPLPASDTATNPFTLAPGEPIPVNEFTTQDVNKHVKLDEESYEKADASNLGFSLGAPILPDVVTPAAQREAEGRGVLDIPIANNIIPESSLPITSVATTEIPEIVKESQEKAEVEPEASAIPEAVEQKKLVEEELKAEIPVIPEAETTTTVAGIMAAAGITSASGEPNDETAPAFVPEIVRESQKEAHVEPEASAVEAAVEAKKEYEQELQKEVHEVAPVTLNSESTKAVAEVPEIVQKSQAEAGAFPEASAVPETVEQKKVVEEELKTEAAAPTPLPKDEPKEKSEMLPSIPPVVHTKTEGGYVYVSNGNATEKNEKDTEANGNGIKSPKKSLENGDDRELKKSKRRSIFGAFKDLFFHSPGTKEKGKAKGDNRDGEVMLRNWMVFLAVIVSAFWYVSRV